MWLLSSSLLLGAPQARAAVKTWDGSASGYWSTAANWTGGVAPVNGDDLVFPPGAAHLANTNNYGDLRLGSITFTGSGYTLRGTALTVADGISGQQAAGANTCEITVVLGAAQTFDCITAGASQFLMGNILNGGYLLTVSGSGSVTLGGVISGAGGVTKTGTGTLTYSGAGDNLYTGATSVRGGALQLAKAGAVSLASAGSLEISGATVRELAATQIGSLPVTINAGGLLDLNGFSDTIGNSLTLNGGDVQTGAGTLYLAANNTLTVSASGSAIYGNFSVGSGTSTWDINATFSMEADVSGSASITKIGPSGVYLNGGNTFTGPLTINESWISAGTGLALGATNGATIVNNTAYLALHNDIDIAGEVLTNNSTYTGGALYVYGTSAVTWTGGFVLNTDTPVKVITNCALALSGPISGVGGIIKSGPGTLTLSGSVHNTYSGDTTVNEGLLALNKSGTANAIRAGALIIGDGAGGANADVVRYTGTSTSEINLAVPITINTSGLLDLNGHSDDVGPLNLDSGRISTGAGLMTIFGTVTGAGVAYVNGYLSLGAATRTFSVESGGNLYVNAVISGTGGITKTDSGFVTLAGANTFSGLLTVQSGYVLVQNDLGLGQTNGATVLQGGTLRLNGVTVEGEPLVVNGSTLQAISAYSVWDGPITLNADLTIDVPNEGQTLAVRGAIGGSGGFTKTGPGTLDLGGSPLNTYAGATFINEGVVWLGKPASADGAIHGSGLTIGDGVGSANSAVVRHHATAWGQIAPLPITVNEDGLLDLNDNNETIGNSLTLNNSGRVQTGGGKLYMANGNTISLNPHGHAAVISGNLDIGATSCTIDGASELAGSSRITAAISGTASLRKTGLGSVHLDASNNYSGLTMVNQGTLQVGDAAALGASAAGTVVSNSASLILKDGVYVGAEPLSLNGMGYASMGALWSASGGIASWAGPITLASDAAIGVTGASGRLTLSGVISGSGSLTKLNIGTLMLSGASDNTYAGATFVNDGGVWLNKPAGSDGAITGSALTIGDGVGDAGSAVVRDLAGGQIRPMPITINTDGLLDLNDNNETIGNSLTFNNGKVETGTGLLTLSANAAILITGYPTIYGRLSVGSGTCTIGGSDQLWLMADVSGSANIVKNGYVSLYLGGANTFTGTFTANTGGEVYPATSLAFGTTNGGTIFNGLTYLGLQSLNVTNEALTLNSSHPQVIHAFGPTTNVWAGPVTLQTNTTISTTSNSVLEVIGAVSGTGGITKLGEGTLILSGTNNNTYSGATIVNEGLLGLAKTAAIAIRSSSGLTIGDGTGGTSADIVRYLAGGDQLNVSVPVTINSSGLLDLNNFSDVLGPITFDGGRLETGSGLGTLNGDIAVLSTSDIFGRIAPSAAERRFHVNSNPVTLRVQAQVVGGGGIAKAGGGTLTLYHSNSYSGLTLVQEGWLHALHPLALGTTDNGTVVSNGASLLLGYGLAITNESLTLNGLGTSGYGALRSAYSYDINWWVGPLHLNSDSTIEVVVENLLIVQGPIDGPGGLTKIGEGTLEFMGTAANTYGGVTRVEAGALVLGQSIHDSAIPGDLIIGDGSGGVDADVVRYGASHPQIADLSRVTIAKSGMFDLSGFGGGLLPSGVHESIGSLSGGGHVQLGDKRLGTGDNDDTTTYSGFITGVGGGLAKFGRGTMTLTSANAYSGLTAIAEGALIVEGIQPTSDVQMAAGGVLGGTGSVGAILSVGGVVSPGTSPGTLSSWDVNLDSASALRVELTPVGSDQLNAGGTVTLGNPALALSATGLLPFEGQQFVIVNNDGADAVAGMFAGLPEGAVVSAGPRRFRITYAGGTGNDVVLVATNTAALYPALAVWQTSSNTVMVAWPQSDINWLLQAAPTVGGTPGSWAEIPPPYPTIDGLRYYSESVLTSNRFYRLHYP